MAVMLQKNYKKVRFIRTFFVLGVILLISSCGAPKKRNAARLAVRETALIDISLPFGATARSVATEQNDDIAIQFVSEWSRERLQEFYRLEMERLGWQCTKLFQTQEETLALYDKPHKVCTLLIREHAKKRIVTLCSGEQN